MIKERNELNHRGNIFLRHKPRYGKYIYSTTWHARVAKALIIRIIREWIIKRHNTRKTKWQQTEILCGG
jgi:hypothetical protein